MANFKKITHFIGKIVLIFIGIVSFYFLAVFFLSRLTIRKESNHEEEVAIYILTNGVHTDIVVPVRNEEKDWAERMPYEHTLSNDTTLSYLALGWGDRGFYLETPTWADLRASTALKAATGLGKTLIHATFYAQMIEDDACKKIMLSRSQYRRLVGYIEDSLEKDEQKNFIHIETDALYGKTDAFYAAKGSYSLFYTCNTWTNEALKVSGQKCCVWTPFDRGIFAKYE